MLQEILLNHEMLHGPLLIEANAGTGKTYSIAHLYLRLLLEHTHPHSGAPLLPRDILLMTFARAATAELRTRIRQRIDEALQLLDGAHDADPLLEEYLKTRQKIDGTERLHLLLQRARYAMDEAAIYTLHAFCIRSISQFPQYFGIPAELTEHLKALQDKALAMAIREWNVLPDNELFFKEFIIDKARVKSEFSFPWSAVEHYSYFRNLWTERDATALSRLYTPEDFSETHPPIDSALINKLNAFRALIVKHYLDLLAEEHVDDFDGFVERMAHLLPQQLDLAKSLLQRYPTALVDEFQDTDARQWTILRSIYLEAAPQEDLPFFCLVGDPKQSIYQFRGADLNVYFKAREEIKARGTQRLLLENHRSQAHLIEEINRLFHLRPQPFIDERLEYADSKAVIQENDPPRSLIYVLPSQGKKPTKPEKFGIIADYIAQRLCAGERADDIAVLVTSNDDIRSMNQELALRHISSTTQTKSEEGSVLQSEMLAHLIDLLKAVVHLTDASALRRALIGPFFNESLQGAQQRVAEGCDHERLFAWQNIWKKDGLAALLYHLLENEDCASEFLRHDNGLRLLCDYQHLLELISHYQKEHPIPANRDFQNVLNSAALEAYFPSRDSRMLRLDNNRKVITVTTIHQSKGLQYPIVILPLFLTTRDEKNQERLQESLRRLYVALTRAKRQNVLFVSDDGKFSPAMRHLLDFPKQAELFSVLQEIGECLFYQPPEDICILPDEPLPQHAAARTLPLLPRPRWQKSSFTALSRNLPQTLGKTYELCTEVASIHSFPRGTQAGSCLHSILEHYHHEENMDLTALCREQLQAFQIDTAWAEVLSEHLQQCLQTNLFPKDFCLSDLNPRHCLREFTFDYWSDAKALRALEPHLRDLSGEIMMNGAADLVFRHEGLFYIVDYKSNALGSSAAAYDHAAMHAAMQQHHYALQAAIYREALRRYLQQRLGEDPRFGGTFYLFLRGMQAGSAQGIYFMNEDESCAH